MNFTTERVDFELAQTDIPLIKINKATLFK